MFQNIKKLGEQCSPTACRKSPITNFYTLKDFEKVRQISYFASGSCTWVLPPSKRRKAPKVAWTLRSSHFSINVFLILFRQEQALALRYVERNSVFEWISLKFIINTSFLSFFPTKFLICRGATNGISFYFTAWFSHFIGSLRQEKFLPVILKYM